MKNFVSFFLLLGIPWAGCVAQKPSAKDIVEKALYAHTGGQTLKTYVMRLDYDTLGKIPSQLQQRNPIKSLIDSIMGLQTDSMKMVMKQQMITGEADFFSSMDKMNRGERRVMISDKNRRQEVLVRIRPNMLKGTLDSTRNLYSGLKGATFRENPVEVIQLMRRDSSELHYTGEAQANGQPCYLIQFKLQGKWLDAYIDKQSNLLVRLSEAQVDEDPLIGRGPDRFKHIIEYQGYRSVKGFRLPVSIEEMTTRFDFTTKWKVSWENINDPLSEDLFAPQVSDRSRSKFRTVEIGGNVWVIEQLDKIQNSRFLIQVTGVNRLNVIGWISNNDEFNKFLLGELEKRFPGYKIDGLFNVENQFGVLSLAGFFAKKAHLYAPKGMGFFAEEKGFRNTKEDSTWHQLLSKDRLNTFDREFQTATVAAIILNPVIEDDFSQYYVCYYLPQERVVYYHGDPYFAAGDSKKALPREKVLYELIKKRGLAVEKIVYSGAFLDNAPLFMLFDEFENRIQNTDFTIYKKRQK